LFVRSPIITCNVLDQREIGSVGKPIGGVTVYIIGQDGKEAAEGEEGEICCSGPNVMRGYYKNPVATAEVISVAPDGKSRMFHTGDLGRMDSTGFVKVTGRLKEQYKLENGRYVVPTPIEEAIGLSRFINQVVLAGANCPYNVVLLVPEWTAIRTAVGADNNVSEEELANDERVIELIDHAIATNCAGMKKFEIPQKWAFVAPFTAANDMLTPKMSIRRHKVLQTYADVVAQLYLDDDSAQKDEQCQGEQKVA
jgi:long-chain acyl-CoA synthetase